MDEVTVMLPAYNEEENLEELVNQWENYRNDIKEKFGYDLKIIVTNDGSKDRTKQIGEQLEKKYDNFKLINHTVNKGLGEAIKTGITYILNNCSKSKLTCLMDCDNTHDPKYILDLLEKQKESNADVVIASRYQTGAKVKGVSYFRLLTSEGAKYVYSFLIPVENVRDYTCGYRLYSNEKLKEAYKRFKSNIVEESGFTCMAELLYKLYKCNAIFAEIPFDLRYDFKKGKSKMRVYKTAKDSIALALRLRKLKKLPSAINTQ